MRAKLFGFARIFLFDCWCFCANQRLNVIAFNLGHYCIVGIVACVDAV